MAASHLLEGMLLILVIAAAVPVILNIPAHEVQSDSDVSLVKAADTLSLNLWRQEPASDLRLQHRLNEYVQQAFLGDDSGFNIAHARILTIWPDAAPSPRFR